MRHLISNEDYKIKIIFGYIQEKYGSEKAKEFLKFRTYPSDDIELEIIYMKFFGSEKTI